MAEYISSPPIPHGLVVNRGYFLSSPAGKTHPTFSSSTTLLSSGSNALPVTEKLDLAASWVVPTLGLECTTRQTSYRIQVFNEASAFRDLVLDTNKVDSNHNTNVHHDVRISPTRTPRHYSIRVKVWVEQVSNINASSRGNFTLSTSSCESPWSEFVVFAAPLVYGFSSSAIPLWNEDRSAQFIYLRSPIFSLRDYLSSLRLDSTTVSIRAATVYITAVPSPRQKLLGAYRLFINGHFVAIGPGRGECALLRTASPSKCVMYDTLDLTDKLQTHLNLDTSTVFAISGYSANTGAIIMQLNVELEVTDEKNLTSISSLTFATNESWTSLDATRYHNPFGKTGEYAAPRENFIASLSPGNWQNLDFQPKNISEWKPAVSSRKDFPSNTQAKVALPLHVDSYKLPVLSQAVNSNLWFFDFGTDSMGGIRLSIPKNALSVSAKFAEVTLSEELDGPYGSGLLLYPMRTGNEYRYLFTLDDLQLDSLNFEVHEYALFRYAAVKICTYSKDGACYEPGPEPEKTMPLCASVTENEKITLTCSINSNKISEVTFASYGNPTGQCQDFGTSNTFAIGNCHANNSVEVMSKLCVGKTECTFTADNTLFKGCGGCRSNGDPCHYVNKTLDIAVKCTETRNYHQHLPDSLQNQVIGEVPFNLSMWRVFYPWNNSDSSFESENDVLNKVWNLCNNTMLVTSLDSTTDSNTRERLPYEADGFITGNSRYSFQKDTDWNLHSARHQFLNPTWPTEWHQFMPLIAYEHYMHTGDYQLASDYWDILLEATYIQCSSNETHLVNFTQCSRDSNLWPKTRDIVDWPMNARDKYVMTDINTVINAFMVASALKLAVLGDALGRTSDAAKLRSQARDTMYAMHELLIDNSTGLFVDGLLGAEKHSAWHAQTNTLWLNISPDTSKAAQLKFLASKGMVGSVYAAYSMLMGLYTVDDDFGNVALEQLTNCNENSWCHMLLVNATATMEAWSREEKPNLSWSHPWASAPGTAIVRGYMGLTATSPAYATWLVKPQPGKTPSGKSKIQVPTIKGGFGITIDYNQDSFTATLSPPPKYSG